MLCEGKCEYHVHQCAAAEQKWGAQPPGSGGAYTFGVYKHAGRVYVRGHACKKWAAIDES